MVTLSSTFGSSRFPRPLDDRRFLIAGPARHCDAEELERVDTGAAILECRPNGNVDGNASSQNGRLLTSAVSSPDLPLARENMPELAHRGVDGRPIHLTWRTVEWIMLPVSPSIRYRISAPAGERASGVEGNERVCMENLRVLPSIIPTRTPR